MDTTFLSVKDLSVKLSVSEKTIYRMINDNKIPYGIKIGGQWRFNAEKIEKWSRQAPEKGGKPNRELSISELLCDSTIMYKLCGNNRDEVLDQILTILNRFSETEKTAVKRSVLYKESIISSSLNGVSVMVSDYDSDIQPEKSVFAVAYLEKKLDFRALDGEKTEIVIMIIPANKTEQLILTTRLSALLTNQDFLNRLKSEPNRSETTELFRQFESSIFKGVQK